MPSTSKHDALLDFVLRTQHAKLVAGEMYAALSQRTFTPDARLALAAVAEDEVAQAMELGKVVGHATLPHVAAPTPPGCGPPGYGPPGYGPPGYGPPGYGLNDQSWPSALMAVFALDQAATGALVALARAPGAALAEAAARLVEQERQHQAFALGSFCTIASADSALGRRLALEMIEARDWIKQIYPRHGALQALADAGVLPADAPKAHDSFLASLGDRVQDALGVLGEL